MTVDLTRQQDGRRQITLGVVEWWIVGSGASLLFVLVGMIYTGITGKLSEQGATQKDMQLVMQTMAQQQAVTSGQITTLTSQLADIPQMRTNVAEIKVRVDRHEQDIKEIRANRGLR